MLPKRIKHRLNLVSLIFGTTLLFYPSAPITFVHNIQCIGHSYNVRPQYTMYWTLSEDVNCPLITRIMSRNRFSVIKSFLHVCNNNELNNDDKWAKLLSIDEQMVPYFGRHSCKQFIRGKPIRFAFEHLIHACTCTHTYMHVHTHMHTHTCIHSQAYTRT